MWRSAALLPGLLVLLLGSPTALPGAINWWSTHGTIKVGLREQPPLHRAAAVEIHAARNEFEPFQVVVRAEPDALERMDLEVGDFSGPNGAVLSKSNVAVYLQRYLEITQPSAPGGETGTWPDALVPKVDRYRKSQRNAFPVNVRRGENQPVWVEVYVPNNTPPGRYTAQARITADGVQPVSFAVNLRVWNFALPSTSTLRTAFGFNAVTALKKHRGSYTNDDDLREMNHLYTKAALLHRISTYGNTMSPPPFTETAGGARIDWRNYDREVGPFLDGTALGAGEPLPGARATSVDIRVHGNADTDEKKVLYWREWVKHFREKGWLDRLYHYVWDEPATGVYPQVAAKARLARRADPAIRNLVTASLHPSLAGPIDIWVPLINCLEQKPGFDDFCEKTVPPAAYNAEIRQGKSFWWYQSCASHGCTAGAAGDYFKGWPTYVVDAPAISHRVMSWLSWKNKVEGELYFATNESWGQELDPWKNLFMHTGNGDGTLFYPGRPEQIGGQGHVPVESIRLKLIREGLEDYEYLVLLSRNGMAEFAERSAGRIAKTLYLWEQRPNTLYLVRQEMGEKLSAANGGENPPATGKSRAAETSARRRSPE